MTHGFDPAISPDGSTVAFTRDGGENGIYLI
ncbi:MAG: PD40 domain-containing protein, partial [Caldilineaceae bacterium]|nr:PD40 domain-containing protein [Caldilineaceae bacterium]